MAKKPFGFMKKKQFANFDKEGKKENKSEKGKEEMCSECKKKMKMK